MAHPCWVVRSGSTAYGEALEIQRTLFTARRAGLTDDVLWLLEHPPTYTIGRRSGARQHLLLSEGVLAERGIRLFEVDRGGDITYHGPGQLIGYPVFDLNAHYQDAYRYLRDLEEVIIRVLGDYGVEAHRIDGLTGVWAEDEKIASIGVKISGWITMHGFALNVGPDVAPFDAIVPCGIRDRGVTSLARVSGRSVEMEEVVAGVIRHAAAVFRLETHMTTLERLMRRIG
jgi:lipoyl(octanoyl) transferase